MNVCVYFSVGRGEQSMSVRKCSKVDKPIRIFFLLCTLWERRQKIKQFITSAAETAQLLKCLHSAYIVDWHKYNPVIKIQP